MLTALELKSMATPAKMIEIADDPEAFPGLRVRVAPTGLITFFHRFRDPLQGGKLVKKTLGRFPELSLKKARQKWAESNKAIGVVEEVTADSSPGEPEQPTSSILGSELVRLYVTWKSTIRKSWRVDDKQLKREFIPVLGQTPIDLITRSDIKGILRSIEERGFIPGRNRVFASIRHMFVWAIENDYIESSPCVGIRQLSEKSRDRVLTEREIKRLYLESSMVEDVSGVYFNLFFFTLLTGCRIGEACHMRWDELDLTAKTPTWFMPSAKTKNGKDHTVFLSRRAVRILESRNEVNEYVWANTGSNNKHILPATAAKMAQIAQKALKMQHWTPHDLRRTMATGLARLGYSDRVLDRVLNHTPAGINAVYNVHRYDDEALEAWTKWEKAVVKMCS